MPKSYRFVPESLPAKIFKATIGASATFASTFYHALPRNRAKQLFRLIDHMAIFLLIAGTFTPFTLGALRGAVGWTLFGAVWSFLEVLGFAVFPCACTSG